MKILLLTHKIDIDGMGSAVLSNLAFEDVVIEFCETFEVDEKLNKYINMVDNYDYIFITDICPSDEMIKRIACNEELKHKIKIFDHHKTTIQNIQDYPFLQVLISNEFGKCCGTSLFYNYLLKNNYLSSKNQITEFVELTRQYDTWEWKDIYNNNLANDLNILFNVFGREKYVDMMVEKLSKQEVFAFDEFETNAIENFKKQLNEKCLKAIDSMIIKTIDGLTVGVAESIDNDCRNEIAEILRNKKSEFDYIVCFISDRDTVSFRSINKEVDVDLIARRFGGKGHKNASSCLKSGEVFKRYLDKE